MTTLFLCYYVSHIINMYLAPDEQGQGQKT